MALKIKNNVNEQAKRLGKMAGPDANILSGKRLNSLAKSYIPLFAGATPQKTGAAANSIEVSQTLRGQIVKIIMSWGTDYIGKVNDRTEFAGNQFKSISNRLNTQAKFEIARAMAEAGKKNKLKVKR
jgi:hypothetical protein